MVLVIATIVVTVIVIVMAKVIPVSVEKHSSGEEDTWEHEPSERQITGWRAASAAGLQGKGWRKK